MSARSNASRNGVETPRSVASSLDDALGCAALRRANSRSMGEGAMQESIAQNIVGVQPKNYHRWGCIMHGSARPTIDSASTRVKLPVLSTS